MTKLASTFSSLDTARFTARIASLESELAYKDAKICSLDIKLQGQDSATSHGEQFALLENALKKSDQQRKIVEKQLEQLDVGYVNEALSLNELEQKVVDRMRAQESFKLAVTRLFQSFNDKDDNYSVISSQTGSSFTDPQGVVRAATYSVFESFRNAFLSAQVHRKGLVDLEETLSLLQNELLQNRGVAEEMRRRYQERVLALEEEIRQRNSDDDGSELEQATVKLT